MISENLAQAVAYGRASQEQWMKEERTMQQRSFAECSLFHMAMKKAMREKKIVYD